ncbi:MAG TPA: RdgB/HAM1 family non-canonical purine NTP pyrophosphatase [Tepidisphaeraceae bacterium]|jgi:XTP/dITP diphosphohydrolase
MRILIATTNAGKLREFQQMLGDQFALMDLSAFPQVDEVEETGKTFAENAALKAIGYAKQTSQWTIADDSGLCVDALAGSPGIFSARWAQRHGRDKGDQSNNELLLEQMHNVADEARGAKFVCALALSDPSGKIVLTTDDFVPGRILREPRGKNGFGYDPLFFVPELNRTAAELLPEEKSRVSHRGRALRKMRGLLESL